MIRLLYPEIARRVQDAIAREGRFMLPDLALVEHVIDLADDEIVASVDALAVELMPHDATPIGPSPVVLEPTIVAPIAATDESAHESPAG